ncbi:MAG: hypothetical protein RLN88_08445 [Ekhidna sp.]|uniref:hypothetical protein n=1 Tax=Ekhidna sp. TaxID=2608089 RepID=UPI0032F00F8B
MKYENRIVLFLDILGFEGIISKTVEKGVDDKEKIASLYSVLSLIRFQNEDSATKSRVVSQFSDSLVVSFREDDIGEFINFFKETLRLVTNLISHGILCRGGISHGKLFHSDEFLFGPALIEAYQTESRAALYPRIILDRRTVDQLRSNYQNNVHDSLRQNRFDPKVMSILTRDTDEKLYIDYFMGALTLFRDEKLVSYFRQLRKLIVAGQRFEQPDIKVKYGWLKNKFNKFLNDLPSVGSDNMFWNEHYDLLLKNISHIK